MKRSIELLRAKNALKEKIMNLQTEGKIEEAHSKLDELTALNAEFEVALALEQEEESKIEDKKEVEDRVSTESVNETVVFNKLLTNKPLDRAETEFLNSPGSPGQIEHEDELGGYLVPEGTTQKIAEFRRQEVALKDYVNVISVTTLSGKMPVSTAQKGTLTEFEELTEIAQSEIKFAQQKWSVRDFGDIIPVSNTLLEDVTIDLFDYIGRQFSKKAVNTENIKILNVLKSITSGTKVNGAAGISDVKGILNTSLDPAISKNAKIYTNQSGYNWLDNLVDSTGRPLLSMSLTKEGTKELNTREVVVLPDALLENAGSKSSPKFPFFIGDLEQAINFYDRKGIEVAISGHAGFMKNATLLRVVERFDVKPYDSAAVVYLELTPPAPAPEADPVG